jgi:hypothetical protein
MPLIDDDFAPEMTEDEWNIREMNNDYFESIRVSQEEFNNG